MWTNPLELTLIPTDDSMSFASMLPGTTGLPLGTHPGAFGVKRCYHTHEGVDLYCAEGSVVKAVEDGTVVAVLPFTGEHANLPWWENTWVVMVEGETGVVAYGEITASVKVGDQLKAGDTVGNVIRVLKKDKGRPMSMLHLELHVRGTRSCPEWYDERPKTLLDPTPYLLMTIAG